MYQEMMKFPKEYDAIAISNITKVRANQLTQIRKKFRNEIKIRVVKNKVVRKAFEKVDGVSRLAELSNRLEGQCLLLFTNINPFRLNLMFDKSKIFLSAKAGDVAPKEITLHAGDTGITPGPVLSEFKEAKVPTKIDQGSIWITKDTKVVEAGGEISQKLASLLSKLNIKPIEAGISVNCALADGLLFEEQDLRIDLDEYFAGLARGFREALNVAMVCDYPTSETIDLMIAQARQDALNLSIQAGYITSDTILAVISSSESRAINLANILTKKGYKAV
jgi:large subunit ribosomal protein L10